MTPYRWIGMFALVLIFAFIVFAFGQGFKVKHLEKVWPWRMPPPGDGGGDD
jgi:hypothetical protein